MVTAPRRRNAAADDTDRGPKAASSSSAGRIVKKENGSKLVCSSTGPSTPDPCAPRSRGPAAAIGQCAMADNGRRCVAITRKESSLRLPTQPRQRHRRAGCVAAAVGCQCASQLGAALNSGVGLPPCRAVVLDGCCSRGRVGCAGRSADVEGPGREVSERGDAEWPGLRPSTTTFMPPSSIGPSQVLDEGPRQARRVDSGRA